MMMKPHEDSESSTYRSAMALNNLAVSMMMEQKGGLHHAISIFKDSFAVMSTEHYIPRGGEFGNVFLPCQFAQESEAQQQQHQQDMAHKLATVPLHPLEICPCDDDDIAVMTKTLHDVAMFVPISLRSIDFYDPQGSHKNANLSLAIMMYNLGLAHLLAHVQDKRWHNSWGWDSPTQEGQELLRGAVVALNCAQVWIDRHLATLGDDSFEKLGTLLVSAMTLKTLMWMSRFDNQAREAEQARALLSHVFDDINLSQYRLRELNVNACNHVTSTAA